MSTFSSNLIRGIDPNDLPNPYPATTASPECQWVQFPNFVLSDTWHIRKKTFEGGGYRFGPEGRDKLCLAPSVCSDLDFTFSTAYRSIATIWMTSILLVTFFCLIWYWLGCAMHLTPYLYCPGLCCPSYSTVHRWSRIGMYPLHLPRAPVWGDSAKATPVPRKMGSTGRRTWKFQGAWVDMRTWWVALDYGTQSDYTPPVCLLHHRCPTQLIPGRVLIIYTYIAWWS